MISAFLTENWTKMRGNTSKDSRSSPGSLMEDSNSNGREKKRQEDSRSSSHTQGDDDRKPEVLSKSYQHAAGDSEHKRLLKEIERLRERNRYLIDSRQDARNHKTLLAKKCEVLSADLREVTESDDLWETKYRELHDEHQKVKSQFNIILGNLITPYVHERDPELLIGGVINFTLASERIRRKAMEADLLREQIGRLQQQMLSSVERSQAVSDEQLAQDFRNLATNIKSLSRNVSRDSLDHIDAMFNDCSLIQGASCPQQELKSWKKNKVEAALWSVLVDTVFKTPFKIFSYLGEDLSITWSMMFDNYHSHLWPSPTQASEVWRYTTMESLIRKSGINTRDTWYQCSEHSDVKIHDAIMEAAEKTYSHLDHTLKAIFHEADLDQIYALVKKAFNLAMIMHSQRCRVQVVYPHVGQSYLAGMETNLVPIPECEDYQSGSVSATINPGLAKWGDAHGKNLGQRLDLVPALVCLEKNGD